MDMATVMLWKPKNRKKGISEFSGIPSAASETGKRKGKKPHNVVGFSFSFFRAVIPCRKQEKAGEEGQHSFQRIKRYRLRRVTLDAGWKPLGEVAAKLVERLR
jgi:hypothetical protein